MNTTTLLWALWIMSGGRVNSGYLAQPEPQAYFQTVDECERVRKIVIENLGARAAQCIQARYVSPQKATP